MIENKGGFTLIELLVVVLIIGILAAIALPQYTKAVERARIVEATQVLNDVAKAQSLIYMQHGSFVGSIEGLNNMGDITVHDAGDAWDDMAFARSSTPEHGEFEQMLLQRNGGMFRRGILLVETYVDGTVLKRCINNSGTEGFCSMARNAGYECITGTNCN